MLVQTNTTDLISHALVGSSGPRLELAAFPDNTGLTFGPGKYSGAEQLLHVSTDVRRCCGPQHLGVTQRSALGDVFLLPYVNLLKPTGYVTHHQFNIQQLYALPTLYLCVLYLSENKQRLVPLTA